MILRRMISTVCSIGTLICSSAARLLLRMLEAVTQSRCESPSRQQSAAWNPCQGVWLYQLLAYEATRTKVRSR
jgi:hypothetical protein